MLSASILSILNEQIGIEFFAANQYLQMAAFLQNKNLCGFSCYLRRQAEEERGHGMSIYDYILEQMGTVSIKEIVAPDNSWENVVTIFESVLALEQKVTALINNILKVASSEGDYATIEFMKDFIEEQIKSENEITCIVETLKLIGSDIGALLAFDTKIGGMNNGGLNIRAKN